MKIKPFAYGFLYRLVDSGATDVFAWQDRPTAAEWRRRLLRNPKEFAVLTPVLALHLTEADAGRTTPDDPKKEKSHDR